MNVLLRVFVVCLMSSYLAVALLRGYDLVQTIGFLGLHVGHMFSLAVVAGIALYALSFFFVPPDRRKAPDEPEDDHSKDVLNLIP